MCLQVISRRFELSANALFQFVVKHIVNRMIWPLVLATCVVATFWLRWRYKNRRLIELASKFPGPPTLPLLGNAVAFMCRPEEMVSVIRGLITDYGDVIRFWLGPDLNIVVNNPDDLKILLTNMKTSYKGPQYKYMADILGGGILSGSGPAWRKHRKIAMPNYGKRAIETYNDIFNEEVGILLTNLREGPFGQMRNIYKDVVKCTTYAVCQTLMGLTRDESVYLPYLQEVVDISPKLYGTVFDRMTKWYFQIDPIFWMSNSYRELTYCEERMHVMCNAIIQHRKRKLETLSDKNKRDLMNAEEDSSTNTQLSVIDRFILSQELTHEEMLDETFTIFTSSQEASAKISSYVLLMMAYHPHCQEKLYAEIKNVIGDEDRWVSDEDLKQMPYLDMVFKEILRLFPIGTMLQRTVLEDIAISSGILPAGSSLVAPIYHLHRDPKYWTNPEAFDPERFNPENTKRRHPNCYIPFSLGPMDCLGRYFGTKLIKTLSVRVLREFKLTSLQSYNDLKLSIAISAAPIGGFKLAIEPRK